MAATLKYSNIIRHKYPELIRLISLISGNKRIITNNSRSLTIKVYIGKSFPLPFTLYQASETSSLLNVGWSVLGSNEYDGHDCFPDYFSQRRMFNHLVSRITDWYDKIVNSHIDKCLKNTQNSADKIKKLFVND